MNQGSFDDFLACFPTLLSNSSVFGPTCRSILTNHGRKWALFGQICTIRSHGNELLGRKLHSGTFKIKGSRAGLVRVPGLVLKVPLCNLRHSIINFVPCDRILQRSFCRLTSSVDKQARPQLTWLKTFCFFWKFASTEISWIFGIMESILNLLSRILLVY